MTIISIHQPSYIPWIGFFEKMIDSDYFIYLDDVQYGKNNLQNRNKIRTSDGDMWLTIPIKSKITDYLNEVKIDQTSRWKDKHKKAIKMNYSKAKNFNYFYEKIVKIFEKNHEKLIDINADFIELIMKELDINTEIIYSSKFNIQTKGSNRIVEICKKFDADEYLSGEGGKQYLDLKVFEQNNIKVKFQSFQHPDYTQCYVPFLPAMSIIDLIFNEGEKSRSFLKQKL